MSACECLDEVSHWKRNSKYANWLRVICVDAHGLYTTTSTAITVRFASMASVCQLADCHRVPLFIASWHLFALLNQQTFPHVVVPQMKPVAFIIAVAAAAALGSLVAAMECTNTTLSFAFIPLAPKAKRCKDESGYSLLPFNAMPLQDETHAMCKSSACKEMLRGAEMPDCTTLVDGRAQSIKKSFNLMRAACLVAEVNSVSA